MFKDGSLDPLDYPAFSIDQFGIDQLTFGKAVAEGQAR